MGAEAANERRNQHIRGKRNKQNIEIEFSPQQHFNIRYSFEKYGLKQPETKRKKERETFTVAINNGSSSL